MADPSRSRSPSLPRSATEAPERPAGWAPVLVFDGHCGFCTRVVEWLMERFEEPVTCVPWQDAKLRALGLTEAEVHRAAWWLEQDGAGQTMREEGHRAAGRALLACRGAWPWLGRLFLAPPFGPLGRFAYRRVAANRGRLPGVTPACERPEGWPPLGVAGKRSGGRAGSHSTGR